MAIFFFFFCCLTFLNLKHAEAPLLLPPHPPKNKHFFLVVYRDLWMPGPLPCLSLTLWAGAANELVSLFITEIWSTYLILLSSTHHFVTAWHIDKVKCSLQKIKTNFSSLLQSSHTWHGAGVLRCCSLTGILSYICS